MTSAMAVIAISRTLSVPPSAARTGYRVLDPPMHELVIFDCDGVLVDSEVISNEVLARMLTREGVPTTLAEARRACQGRLLTDVRDRAQARLGRAFPPGWVAEYEDERDEAFRRELTPVEGAAEAVQRVKAAGLGVCVASQGRLTKTRLTLGITGLRELFPPYALFSAYDVARPKPDPALFQHAAATMNVSPSACAVIEDSPSGILAAVGAGMRAIGYAADSDERALRNAGATEIIRSLDGLPKLLGLLPA
jgi:HAD superfamily hydrolase (TIGR01509 family)